MESIPTISLKNYKKNKEAISKEIYNACNKVGFFSIIDHDLNIDLIKKVLRLSKEFFNQTNNDIIGNQLASIHKCFSA